MGSTVDMHYGHTETKSLLTPYEQCCANVLGRKSFCSERFCLTGIKALEGSNSRTDDCVPVLNYPKGVYGIVSEFRKYAPESGTAFSMPLMVFFSISCRLAGANLHTKLPLRQTSAFNLQHRQNHLE